MDKHGNKSLVWKFWTQGDEAYLKTRDKLKTKISFHYRTGISRCAVINKNLSGDKRAIYEWKRPNLENLREGEAYRLIELIIPRNFLSPIANFGESELKKKKINYINSSVEKTANLVRVFISKDNKEFIEKKFTENEDSKILNLFILRSGAIIGISVHEIEYKIDDIILPSEGPPGVFSKLFGDIFVSEDLPPGKERNVRICSLIKTNPVPTVVEFSGYQISSPRV